MNIFVFYIYERKILHLFILLKDLTLTVTLTFDFDYLKSQMEIQKLSYI